MCSVISIEVAQRRRRTAVTKSTSKGSTERTDILATEWDLLEALWKMERATAPEITAALADRRGWAYSTVKTLLDRMVDKGLVNARQVGSVWEYTPALPQQKARRWAWRRFVDMAFGGAVAPSLEFVARETRKLSKKERAQLKALIEQIDDRSDNRRGSEED
jgi:BlaI family transcriptional regulator, penicillinase repressor